MRIISFGSVPLNFLMSASVLLLGSAGYGRAALLIGNLNGAVAGTSTAVSSTYYIATGFGNNAETWALQSITLRLFAVNGPISASLEIWADSGTAPASPATAVNQPAGFPFFVGTQSVNAPSSAPVDYVFTAASSFTIDPSTSYWLVIRCDCDRDISKYLGWTLPLPETIDSASQPGTSVFSQNLVQSSGAGSSWNNLGSTASYHFAVTVADVPEPESSLMGGFGIIIVAWFRLWRRNLASRA